MADHVPEISEGVQISGPAPAGMRRHGVKSLKNATGIVLLWLCGLVTLAVLVVIIGYILARGIGVINWNFLTQSPKSMGREGGIFPTIVGSVGITAIAILAGAPLGIGAALYMAEYAGENLMTKLVRFGADSLAGIPSIMFGMFGYLFFVYYMHMGFSLMAGGLTLALMALPIILRVSEEAIKVVPDSYRLGSLALGASKWQTIRKVVLPTAVPGIITGIMLGMGRAIGETAAVMLTAGTVAKIPWSIFAPVRTMTLHTYILAMENISMDNAFGTSAVLVILILAITIASSILTGRYMEKLGGKTR
jgi:phosphate transport system permease protein